MGRTWPASHPAAIAAGVGAKQILSFAEHRRVVLDRGLETVSACELRRRAHVGLVRRERNVQSYYDREQRRRPVEEILRCSVCRDGRQPRRRRRQRPAGLLAQRERFMVSKPIDGKPASHANGGTIGFSMSGREQVDACTKLGSRMAAHRSRTRPGSAKGPPARCISPICAIPTATNYARFIACRPEGRRSTLRRAASPAVLVFAAARQKL